MSGQASRSVLAKTAHGTGWVVGWRMATRALGLVSTLCLVRLLSPADFGLVALGTGFAQAIDGLAEIGVENALVRERERDRDVYDTAFTLNLLRFALTSVAIAAAAAPIGRFFGDPRLAAILLALAASTVLGGLMNIAVVDFRRDFAFQKEFRLQVVPRLLSIVVAVGAAWIWRSYWALVAGIISARVLRLVAGYVMLPYRPRLSLRAWRGLVGYSTWTWCISLGMLLRDRIDAFAIGRLMQSVAVGAFTAGAEIASLPTTELVEPLNRAAFSGFAEIRRQDGEATEICLRVVGLATLLTMPAGIGISLVAAPIVRLALGARWIAAVPVLQLLGCVSLVVVFGNMAMVLLGAHARLRPIFVAVGAGFAARLALLLALIPGHGLAGAAVAATVAIVLEQALMTASALRVFAISARALGETVWRPVLGTVVMACVLVAWILAWGAHPGAGGAVRPPAMPPAMPPTMPATIWATMRATMGAAFADGRAPLAGTIVLGATVYGATVLAAWLARGRPDGAEADAMRLLARLAGPSRRQGRGLRRLARRLGRVARPGAARVPGAGERKAATRIAMVDLSMRGARHAPFNAALLRIAAAARPDATLEFWAEDSHADAVRALLPPAGAPPGLSPPGLSPASLPPKSFRTLRWRSLTLAPQGGGQGGDEAVTARRLLHDTAWLLRVARAEPGRCVLVVSSLSATGVLAACAAHRLLGPRRVAVQLVLHGNLGSIRDPWRPRNPLFRLLQLAPALRFAAASGLRLLVLEEAIAPALSRLIPKVAAFVDVLPHPAEAAGAPGSSIPGNPPRLGMVGLVTRAKGASAFLDLAARIGAEYPGRIGFAIAGRLHAELAGQHVDMLDGPVGCDELPRPALIEAVRRLDYVCLPHAGGYYDFAASGSLLDAIAACRPLVALRRPVLEALFERFGDLGYLCRDMGELGDVARRIARGEEAGRFAGQVAAMARLRASRLPENLAPVYRAALDRLQRPKLEGSAPKDALSQQPSGERLPWEPPP